MKSKIKSISPFNFNEFGKSPPPEECELALVYNATADEYNIAVWLLYWKEGGSWYDPKTWREGGSLLGQADEIVGVTHWTRLTEPKSLTLI